MKIYLDTIQGAMLTVRVKNPITEEVTLAHLEFTLPLRQMFNQLKIKYINCPDNEEQSVVESVATEVPDNVINLFGGSQPKGDN